MNLTRMMTEKPFAALPMFLLHEATPAPSLMLSHVEVVVLYSHHVCMGISGIPWPSLVILPYTVTVLFWAGEGLSTHAVTKIAAGVDERAAARVRVGVTPIGVGVSVTLGAGVGDGRVYVGVGRSVGLGAVEVAVGQGLATVVCAGLGVAVATIPWGLVTVCIAGAVVFSRAPVSPHRLHMQPSSARLTRDVPTAIQALPLLFDLCQRARYWPVAHTSMRFKNCTLMSATFLAALGSCCLTISPIPNPTEDPTMDPDAMRTADQNDAETTSNDSAESQDLLEAISDALTMMEVAIRTMRQAIMRARPPRSEPD